MTCYHGRGMLCRSYDSLPMILFVLGCYAGNSYPQVRDAFEANKTYGESLDSLALFYYNLLLEPFLSARHILVSM